MKKYNIRWQLVIYDIVLFLILDFILLFLYQKGEKLTLNGMVIQSLLAFVCIFTARFIGRIYQQIWRYGGIQCYIRVLVVDGCAAVAYFFLEQFLPIEHISFPRLVSIACLNLLGVLATRMIYRYAYKCGNTTTAHGRFLNLLLRIFAGEQVEHGKRDEAQKIKIAIIGAGRIGVSLAEELIANRSAAYRPVCFVDVRKDKADRSIHGLPVYLEDETTFDRLKMAEIQEVVFAVPNISADSRRDLYARYLNAGYKVKVYDYPMMQAEGGKRHLREFDIEELLFRKPIAMQDEKTNAYYNGKVVLITGGGGSIGSELCRQLAKMHPKQIIILDIYENGAYDVQQELRIAYGNRLDVRVEIASINNVRRMTKVFEAYRPQIIINAAAHKHVPLMEKNCI